MKCRRCKQKAVVDLHSRNTAFCKECFFVFFTRQVEKAIKSRSLFRKEDRILIALSGGKDSLALSLELKCLGYDVTCLHVDLAIGESSAQARRICENFCNRYELPLIIKETAEEGLPIPLVKSRIRQPICSVCGRIKRYYFNHIARSGEFTVLATGHNLDDETARLFSNTLRWDRSYLSDQGPYLPDEGGFVRKVKPLYRLTEFETANYAFLKGIEYGFAPCPYSKGASFTFYKKLLADLEDEMPGTKISFYEGFLDRGRRGFAAEEAREGDSLSPCTTCGYPTSEDECGVCRLKKRVATEAE